MATWRFIVRHRDDPSGRGFDESVSSHDCLTSTITVKIAVWHGRSQPIVTGSPHSNRHRQPTAPWHRALPFRRRLPGDAVPPGRPVAAQRAGVSAQADADLERVGWIDYGRRPWAPVESAR